MQERFRDLIKEERGTKKEVRRKKKCTKLDNFGSFGFFRLTWQFFASLLAVLLHLSRKSVGNIAHSCDRGKNLRE